MSEKRAFALGFFDGVHKGHAEILKTCVREAKKHGLVSAALAFKGSPKSGTKGGQAPLMITTFERRVELMREAGIDFVAELCFDRLLAGTSPESFVKDILIGTYDCALCVCGEDFHFGKGAAGTPDTIRALGLPCITVPPVMLVEEKISSTLIRRCVKEGHMQKAASLLGRDFSLYGEVVQGRGVGRTLGFPTVNIEVLEGLLTPKHGVYSTTVTTGGKTMRAVTNVGTRPTFGGGQLVVESHIFDFTGTLYGTQAEVTFKRFLREEHAFESPEQLTSQIARDVWDAQKDLV